MSLEASTENEKAPPRNARLSWLKPKQDSTPSSPSAEERASPDLDILASLEEDLKPVSFTGLFRSVPVPFLRPIIYHFLLA
jgi:hypothetical protein